MAEHAVHDLEQKEVIDRSRFLDFLRNLHYSLEHNQPLEVTIDGRHYVIPEDAGKRGRFRVEYEIDKGEYEFELTMKWR